MQNWLGDPTESNSRFYPESQNRLSYRVIKKTLDSTLVIYFWEWVYDAKDFFIIFDKGAN